MLSWILTSYLGRRDIYVWGSLINVAFLVALGVAGSVGKSNAASLAQASLGLIVSVGFTLGPAPASWVIIGETSAIRLRPLTTGLGRAAYYVVNIPCIFLSTYLLNPTVRFCPVLWTVKAWNYEGIVVLTVCYRGGISAAGADTFGRRRVSCAFFWHTSSCQR
jgi:hypothetical protein